MVLSGSKPVPSDLFPWKSTRGKSMVVAKTFVPDGTVLWSDEPEMESSQHYFQLMLLMICLQRLWTDRDDFFIGANLTIYFSPEMVKNKDFRGPDFFLVKNVLPNPRRSWVVWEEDDRFPNVIIELLSDSTASVDRTKKKQIYQDRFQTQEYFWFSPDTLEFEGFRLVDGIYEPIELSEQGWRWSEELGLFLGVRNRVLRYFQLDGTLVPTPQEAELQERSRTERAEQRANIATQQASMANQQAIEERQRKQQLMDYLRSIGVDPEQI
jgi:Uma2 family endonuclease